MVYGKQIPVDGIEDDDRDSDESSVDSATNFDMQTPVSQDRFDEETYDDYNESHLGFSAPTFTAEDVGQSYHPSRKQGAWDFWNHTSRDNHEKRY